MRDEHLVQGRLEGLRARTWFIWGGDDTLVEPGMAPAWLDEMARAGIGSAAFVLDAVGHSPHIEGTARTIALMTAMLRGADLGTLARIARMPGIRLVEGNPGNGDPTGFPESQRTAA